MYDIMRRCYFGQILSVDELYSIQQSQLVYLYVLNFFPVEEIIWFHGVRTLVFSPSWNIFETVLIRLSCCLLFCRRCSLNFFTTFLYDILGLLNEFDRMVVYVQQLKYGPEIQSCGVKRRTVLYGVSDYLYFYRLDDIAYFDLILYFTVRKTVQSQTEPELRDVEFLFGVGLTNVLTRERKNDLYELRIICIVAGELLVSVNRPQPFFQNRLKGLDGRYRWLGL